MSASNDTSCKLHTTTHNYIHLELASQKWTSHTCIYLVSYLSDSYTQAVGGNYTKKSDRGFLRKGWGFII